MEHDVPRRDASAFEGYCNVEASKVEGFNEMMIQIAGAVAAGSSGHLLHFSWEWLILAAWPILVVDIASVIAFKLWRVTRGRGYLGDVLYDKAGRDSSSRAPLLDELK